jgi:hypothetical protein
MRARSSANAKSFRREGAFARPLNDHVVALRFEPFFQSVGDLGFVFSNEDTHPPPKSAIAGSSRSMGRSIGRRAATLDP